MKPDLVITLKELALFGGTREPVAISSRELSEKLQLSQQSASKKILELLDGGYISRNLGVRKQLIQLTPKGLDVLSREYGDYQRVFEAYDHVMIRGTVASGMGEGKYYVTRGEYSKQFKEKFWFEPYEGTLNLKVPTTDMSRVKIIHESEGIDISGFESGGRRFGDVKGFLCKVQDLECAIIFPKRSHYNDVLEVISKYNLRDTLGLKDGDVVEISISL